MRDGTVHRRDISQYLAGGGCLLSIPLLIAFTFRSALKYAQKKEHQFAHQVEEVELEGTAGQSEPVKDSLEKFVRKLERVSAPFAKMGGRFRPEDYQRQSARLEALRARVQEEAPSDAECRNLLGRANQCLQQYAPPS